MNAVFTPVSDRLSISSMALSSKFRASVCSLCGGFSVPIVSYRLPKRSRSSAIIYFFTGHRPISSSSCNAKPARGENPGRSRKCSNVDEFVSDSGKKEGNVLPTELHKEATEAYMAYAMSVMLGRALPDARDGLKPVHRRILYAMHELGLSSRKPHKKCARVVGEVLGKFHPHGDNAVYDSLVRMAQDFSLRFPLIQGHGNFGSIDADPPAAMRYTECRLDGLAEAMLLADLEQDTVDFIPNFDNSQKEPSVLPARVPALLLNGSSGIAVGMATSIPPHNLGELVDALSLVIQNPDATLQELLECIPGPDFLTGGVIMGNIGILEAYKTGRGRIIVRGKACIETIDSKSKRTSITVSEIPYQTNKASLVEKIAELVENKHLEGISDIRDESDRSGMRVVVELKRGSDPSVVLNSLYRLTALQCTFSCNMVSIINGQPKQMGLKELLQEFLDFRCSVVERRAKFQLSRAQNRRVIVEGIIIGLENVDRVIHIIRDSSSDKLAFSGLIKEFSISEEQAEAVMDINLRKLSSLERKKFIDENNYLMEEIARLEDLLSGKQKVLALIEQEAMEIKRKFATPRRSRVDDINDGEVEEIDVIPDEEILLSLSEKGYVKRVKPSMFTLQNRGTIGKSVGKLRVNDTMVDFVACRARDHILYFSDNGVVYSARAYKIPESSRAAAGTPLAQVFPLDSDEQITSIIPVSEFDHDVCLVMLTVNGYVKKVPLRFFSSIRSTGIIAIELIPGDKLKWSRLCTNDDVVAIASRNGMVILSSCNTIRSVGRKSRGYTAMQLKENDKVASIDVIPASLAENIKSASNEQREKSSGAPWLLFLSENGCGKRVPVSTFGLSHLNRVGVIGCKFSPEDRLSAVFVVGFSLNEDGESDEQVLLVSQSGTVNRIKVRDISVQSRYARGVILMRLDHDAKIQSASLISATESEGEAPST